MKTEYPKAVRRVAWWYILTTFSITIAVFDILPDWWGYILLCLAIDDIAAWQPTAKLLKPIAYLITPVVIIRRILFLLGISMDMYAFEVVISVIYLYIHFQICTNIYDTVITLGTEKGQTIEVNRNITTVTYTIAFLAEQFATPALIFYAVLTIHIISKTVLIFALWGHSSQRETAIKNITTAENIYA